MKTQYSYMKQNIRTRKQRPARRRKKNSTWRDSILPPSPLPAPSLRPPARTMMIRRATKWLSTPLKPQSMLSLPKKQYEIHRHHHYHHHHHRIIIIIHHHHGFHASMDSMHTLIPCKKLLITCINICRANKTRTAFTF